MKPTNLAASLALCVCAGLSACGGGGAGSPPAVDALAMPANPDPRLAAAATTLMPTAAPARLLPQPWDETP